MRNITSSLQLLPLTPVRMFCTHIHKSGKAIPYLKPSMAPYDFHDDVFFPIFGPCGFHHLVLELLSSLPFQFQNNMHLLWKIFSITGARDVNVEYILLQHLLPSVSSSFSRVFQLVQILLDLLLCICNFVCLCVDYIYFPSQNPHYTESLALCPDFYIFLRNFLSEQSIDSIGYIPNGIAHN